MDLNSLSDEELDAFIANERSALEKPATFQGDLNSLSDADLDAFIANEKSISAPPVSAPSSYETLQQDFDAKKANFFERVGNDVNKRLASGQETANEYVNSNQGFLSGLKANVEFAGNMGAGLGSDIIGQGLVSAGRGISNVTGGLAGKVGNNVLDYVANSPVGDAAKFVGGAYSNFEDKNPSAARTVGAVGNLLGVAGAFTPINGGVSAVGATGKAIEGGADLVSEGAKVGAKLGGKAINTVGDAVSSPVNKALENVVTNNLDDYGFELAKKARDIGIKIPLDSIVNDGALKTIGQVSQSTPFSGVKTIDKANLEKWSAQVGKTIGSDKPINARVLSEAKTRFGAQFDKIETGRNITLDQDFLAGFDELRMIANEASTVDVSNIINRQLDKLESNLKINPELPFSVQNIKPDVPVETLANLRKSVNGLSGKSANYEISSALGDVEGFLSDSIVNSLDDIGRAEYGDLKRQYRNFIAIKKAVKLDPENALSSPSKLLNSVATVYKDFPTGGGGELGDLARIGKMFVSPRSQGSNTMEKLATTGAVLSIPSAIVNPLIPLAVGTAVTGGRVGKNIIYNQKAIDSAIKKNLSKQDLQKAFDAKKTNPLRITVRPSDKGK